MIDNSRGGISRRALLQALLAHAAGSAALAQATRSCEAAAAGERRRDARLAVLPRADAQRGLDRDPAQPDAAACAGVGVPEGDGLRRRRPSRADIWCSCTASADEEIVECLQPETGMRATGSFRYCDRVRGSLWLQQRTAIEPGHRRRQGLHRGRRRGSCIASSFAPATVVWKPEPAGGLQSAAGLLRHRVNAAGRRQAAHRQRRRAGRPVCRGARQSDRPRGLACRQGMGPELRVARSGRGARPAACVRVRGRRVRRRPPAGCCRSTRPTGASTSRFHGAAAPVRVGQRLLPGGVRQQGVHLRELSHRRSAPRRSGRTSAIAWCGRRRSSDFTSTRRSIATAICTASTGATSRTHRWRAWTWRAARPCGARRPSGRRSSRRAARNAGSSSAPTAGRCSRWTATSCASASSGTCSGWTCRRAATKRSSRAWLFAARESWALPVLSRGLLYVVQNTRDIRTGAGPRLLCYDLRG